MDRITAIINSFNAGEISSFTMFNAFLECGMDEDSALDLRDKVKFSHPDFNYERATFVPDYSQRLGSLTSEPSPTPAAKQEGEA